MSRHDYERVPYLVAFQNNSGVRDVYGGLAEIVVLWIAILLTQLNFHRVNKAAGWLFVPYLVWVAFATILNFTLWRMNPS